MVITNKFGLPESIATFARSDKYTKGNADISVTSLIDMVWALFGTAVHRILEQTEENDNVIVEERLFAEIAGWTLSGALDHQELLPDGTVQITDYKVTSAWSVIFGDRKSVV